MGLIGAIQNGLGGLRAFSRTFESAARRISREAAPSEEATRPPSPPQASGRPGPQEPATRGSIETDMVRLLQARRGLEANLKAVREADRMLGRIIDLKG